MRPPIAHITQAQQAPTPKLHHLAEHLEQVATLAQQFADKFGSGQWAYLAGLWHDLGKYRQGFQDRIYGENGYDAHLDEGEEGTRVPRPDRHPHANAGALFALQRFEAEMPLQALKPLGRILAYLIAGHHAGLADWVSVNASGSALSYRLDPQNANGAPKELAEARSGGVPSEVLNAPLPSQDQAISSLKRIGGFEGFALWIRMLFSCLVDADSLDTEAFYDPDAPAKRSLGYKPLPDLLAHLNSHLDSLAAAAPQTVVNQARVQVLANCRAKAQDDQGIFTLTVPTGGGKTLSSLAFALEHAKLHTLQRVIYAIPYTSIIEQTAQVFRGIPGFEDQVLEHHSNLAPEAEDPQSRLASENWDAPIIVTTNVQLFESLFGAKRKQCRKLHNIANSVIILDEAQTVSRDYLAPILQALRLLARHYGTSIVLSTATQPMLGDRYDSFGRMVMKGLYKVEDLPRIEICPDSETLYATLRRVEIHPPENWQTATPWEEVAARVLAHPAVLVIVNTRAQCRELFDLISAQDPHAVHLSALMCGEHRSEVIAEIKTRLKAYSDGTEPRPLRVVSTQLVEAGVDLDFPVVFRAAAGLDSIAQAAGRCNREGKRETGHVYVFNAGEPHQGMLRQGYDTAKGLIEAGKVPDLLAPAAHTLYFDHLYERGELDCKEICNKQTNGAHAEISIPFRSIANDFQLIEEYGESIVVPFIPLDKESKEEKRLEISPVHQWLKMLENKQAMRDTYRKLQRYTVSVPKHTFDKMVKDRLVCEKAGLWVATANAYHEILGLVSDPQPYSPDSLCV